jgi:tetratricopeptide (TPR) repeat protein
MGRLRHVVIVLTAIIVIPAGICIWWWYYWPAYHKHQVLVKAEQILEAGEFAKCEQEISQLLRTEPNDMRAQFLHGRSLRRLGRHEEAALALMTALQLGFPEDEGKRELALNQAAVQFNSAEPLLKRIQETDPGDLEVAEILAQGYSRSQRWPEAEQACTILLKTYPGVVPYRFMRGQARLELGHYDLAAADFRALLENSPKQFDARLLLAHCLLSNAHIAEAENELLACRKLQPAHPGPLIGLANCALENGNLDKAQELIQEARALAPNAPMALHIQGSLYLRRQRYDLAIPLYEALLKVNDRDKEAHLKLAQALAQTGDLKRAQEHQDLFQQLDRADAEGERRRRLGRQ